MIRRIKVGNNQITATLSLLSIIIFYAFENMSGNAIIALAINMLAFAFAIQQNGAIIHWNKAYVFLVLFVIYCFLTAKWAFNPGYAIAAGVSILVCYLIMLFLFENNRCSSYSLLKLISIAGVIMGFISILYYGPSTIFGSIMGVSRISNDLCNANVLGILFAISIIIIAFQFTQHHNPVDIALVIFLVAMILATQSRKALVVVTIGVIAVFLIAHESRSTFINLFKAIIIIALTIVVIRYLLTLPAFKSINERFMGLMAMFTGVGEMDGSSMLRQMYLKIGMEQFHKTPILGIGMDNARTLIAVAQYNHDTYTHNNYVELLCDGGIVGLILYYSFRIYMLIQYIKNRKYFTAESKLCLFLLILLTILDYGMVSYIDKTSYLYILPVYIEMTNLESKAKNGYSFKQVSVL